MLRDPTPASTSEVSLADAAIANAALLDRGEQLEATLRDWADAPALGLDTEFVRERTFFPQPGLIQISNGHQVVLVDAVALPTMPALGRTLAGAQQVKILHSVGEDLEVLEILCGQLPQPLFDTQIAAAMLGWPLQLRYEHLIALVFEVELPGGKARSDWRKRPLTPDLATYASQDVIWLPRLHEVLAERLEQAGRLAWLKEDCARLVNSAGDRAAEPAALRVKGAGNLNDTALEVLERLAHWRESEARRRDLPRSFVIRDENLLTLAQGQPGAERNRLLRELPQSLQRRHGEALATVLESEPLPEFKRPMALVQISPQDRGRIKQAQSAVTRIAEELGVDPALLASRRELAKVIRGECPNWTQGWRREILAEVLDLA